MNNVFHKLHIYGIVQGVGFRPFIALIAEQSGVRGSVCNKGPYVEVFVGGTEAEVSDFERRLTEEAPERSSILKVETTEIDSDEFDRTIEEQFAGGAVDTSEGAEALTDKPFRIIQSEKVQGDIFVSPDIATCPKCERELFDPSDRRYLHPFINCTACGPRLTILDSMPYDRVRTSMAEFPMCPDCEAEYTSPKTRRYHAQPVCCNDCGPELYLAYDGTVEPAVCAPDRSAETLSRNEALFKTRSVIRDGGIVALKGIGGFHLCCDATNETAVARLRELKDRPFKPFAVMLKDLDVVKRECVVLDGQEALLTGPQKPILLFEKRTAGDPAQSPDETPKLCPSIAPDNPNVGVMLPYNPVQYLLFTYPEDPDDRPFPDCLVMTSGNPRGAPICRTDEEALEVLAPLCDLILSHDRKIRLRADDSVVSWHAGKPYMIRRSRGYAPLPFWVEGGRRFTEGEQTSSVEPTSALGIGGELKNTFCLAKGSLYYPSPYIGDMADLRSVEALKEAVHRCGDLLEIKPDVIVCDKHPLYHSSEVAKELGAEMGVPVLEIQHHYAHTLSCMAENDHLEPVIGVSFDGTGYGDDGSIWGGEFLLCDVHGFERAGSIEVFPQAGGDASSKEGWRIAVSLLKQALDEDNSFPDSLPAPTLEDLTRKLGLCDPTQLSFLEAQIEGNINCVPSTSAGRVFDAASAILGFRRESTCEGEASMVLEFAAERYAKRFPDGTPLDAPTFLFGADPGDDSLFRLPTAAFLLDLALRSLDGESPDKLAYEFHLFLADLIVSGCILCRERSGRNTVALSGGVFQNLLLTDLVVSNLEENDF
ncbi:MAG: carbamoyltransferase HypF, partial [Clostridia bacterium]|nr:carbamoyltransferase HypF [Clostridia bacterium]